MPTRRTTATNASPTAVRAALDTVAALPAQRRTLVLGDMADLGAAAQALHEEAGRMAAASVDRLITLGRPGRPMTGLAARQAGACRPRRSPSCHAQRRRDHCGAPGVERGRCGACQGQARPAAWKRWCGALMAEPAQAPQRPGATAPGL
ncbi:MAG: glutamate ligase domain-containing protein [Anaerolineae bacterium]